MWTVSFKYCGEGEVCAGVESWSGYGGGNFSGFMRPTLTLLAGSPHLPGITIAAAVNGWHGGVYKMTRWYDKKRKLTTGDA